MNKEASGIGFFSSARETSRYFPFLSAGKPEWQGERDAVFLSGGVLTGAAKLEL